MSRSAKSSAKSYVEPPVWKDVSELPPLPRRNYPFNVTVRTGLGDDLEALEAHGDGISFRSPRPMQGGQMVELVICRAILVDAEVVGCAPLGNRDEGYWIRARFHNSTPEVNAIVCDEVSRILTEQG